MILGRQRGARQIGQQRGTCQAGTSQQNLATRCCTWLMRSLAHPDCSPRSLTVEVFGPFAF
jgi:hypothetical protein